MIRHAPSGKIYVGSAAGRLGFRDRYRSHRDALRANRHKNQHLQSYYAQYGATAFVFCILELTTRQSARAAECAWLDKLKPWENGFNVMQRAEESWTRAVKTATREKLAAHNAKPFRLEFEGQIFSGTNLAAFSRERGLHQGAMTQVLLGKKRQFKGWTLPGKPLPQFEILSPSGEVLRCGYFRLSQFARKNGLNVTTLRRILTGHAREHRGWRLPNLNLVRE